MQKLSKVLADGKLDCACTIGQLVAGAQPTPDCNLQFGLIRLHALLHAVLKPWGYQKAG